VLVASSAKQLQVLDGVGAAHRERDDVVVLEIEVATALNASPLISLEDRLPNVAGIGSRLRACGDASAAMTA
jgi:hypothetical protein